MIGPCRAVADPRFSTVVFSCMSQGGKTAALAFSVIGHRLDTAPAPVLYIGPTKSNLARVVEPKLDAMIRGTPSLAAKTIWSRRKYTAFQKWIAGVTLRLAWAGSATELAADPACLVIVDEIDRMEANVAGEGSVKELADARHSTYQDGTTLVISTPTEGNVDTMKDARTGLEHWARAPADQVPSAVWLLWQDGTRHEWSWPCPECRAYFIPRWSLMQIPPEADAATARAQARLACPHCGALIDSERKGWMNARGVYVAPGQRPKPHEDGAARALLEDFTAPERPVCEVEYGDFALPAVPAGEDATFWMSGIASFATKKTFGELASRYVKALRSGDPERVKGVVNTQLGEAFRFGGEAPAWEQVAAHRVDYRMRSVPPGVAAVFLAVDVQKDRLVWALRGWGAGMRSWLIDVGELHGDTALTPVWSDLDDLLGETIDGHRIRRAAIDSGYRPDPVYAFCRRHKGVALPTKGSNKPLDRPYYSSRIDVTPKGAPARVSLHLWHVDTDRMKSFVHQRVRDFDEAAGRPSVWHLPADVPQEYCRQIVNEERIVRPDGRVTWRKVGDNHWLDCEQLQVFLARLESRRIDRLARRLPATAAPAKPADAPLVAQPAAPPPEPQPAQAPRLARRKGRGNFATKYRL